MSMTEEYRKMSEDEIKQACREICKKHESSGNTEAAKDEIEQKFGTRPAITFSEPDGADQRMMMGMIHAPNEGTISF